ISSQRLCVIARLSARRSLDRTMHMRIGSAVSRLHSAGTRSRETRNAGAVSLDTASATAHIRAMIATSPPVSGAFTTPQAANADVLSALLALRRPLVMGILNITPDSFSDGGAFLSPDAAVAHAKQMMTEGVDIIDIGAESTRPQAVAVSAGEELRRLEFVLPAVVCLGHPVS